MRFWQRRREFTNQSPGPGLAERQLPATMPETPPRTAADVHRHAPRQDHRLARVTRSPPGWTGCRSPCTSRPPPGPAPPSRHPLPADLVRLMMELTRMAFHAQQGWFCMRAASGLGLLPSWPSAALGAVLLLVHFLVISRPGAGGSPFSLRPCGSGAAGRRRRVPCRRRHCWSTSGGGQGGCGPRTTGRTAGLRIPVACGHRRW